MKEGIIIIISFNKFLMTFSKYFIQLIFFKIIKMISQNYFLMYRKGGGVLLTHLLIFDRRTLVPCGWCINFLNFIRATNNPAKNNTAREM